ncbi:MAG: FecR domain-containing protein [Chloroflexota bacterium]
MKSPSRSTVSIHPIWAWAVAFLVIVVACSTPSPNATSTTIPLGGTSATSLSRTAQIVEVNGTVKLRLSVNADWSDATAGQALTAGTQIQTFAGSTARIDVSPGTIVRIGASTLFTVGELAGDNTQPVTRLDLLSGKVWVILNAALNGGSFDVQTPVGVAAVRGSYLGVDYDDIIQNMISSCLEGNCNARNNFGITDMIAEQETSIINADLPPLPPTTMDPDRLEKWREFVKEAAPLIAPAETRMVPTWAAPNFENTRAAIQTLVPRPSATPNSTRPPNPATEQSVVLTRVFNPTAEKPTFSSGQFNRLTQMATSQPTLNPTRVSDILTRIATSVIRASSTRPNEKTPEPTRTPRPIDPPKPTETPDKPTEPVKPTETPRRPTESVRPTDPPKPTDPPRPTNVPRPTDPPKPTDPPARPTDPPKPTDPPPIIRPTNPPPTEVKK